MKNLKCVECCKEFPKVFNLVRHMKLVHDMTQEKHLKCLADDCQFTTDSKKQMKKHSTMSHGVANLTVKCSKCEFSCYSSSGLRHHMVTIHGTACPVCDKLFSSEDRLEVHMKAQHEETQSRSTVKNSVKPDQIIVSRRIGEHAFVKIPDINICDENPEEIIGDENENVIAIK